MELEILKLFLCLECESGNLVFSETRDRAVTSLLCDKCGQLASVKKFPVLCPKITIKLVIDAICCWRGLAGCMAIGREMVFCSGRICRKMIRCGYV